MSKVKNGKYVQVHYEGTLQNGDIFDTSQGGLPLEIKVGEGQLISGFEEALIGMEMDEAKKFTLPPEKAYGDRDESLERSFERSQIPPEMDPKVGDTVALHTAQGHTVPVRIKGVDDQNVVVDLNHPLAGETLTFDIRVVGITDQPTQAGCGCGCGEHDHEPSPPTNCGGCSTPGGCH
jgi:peptidylprolyl isomerase